MTLGSERREDEAVRNVLKRVYAAWAANDAEAFVVDYAEDAVAHLPGVYLPGKMAIRDLMAALFDSSFKGSRGIHQVQEIRYPGDSVAVVISHSGTAMAGESEPAEENRTFDTWVLRKQEERWLVEAFHSCPAMVRPDRISP